jgi:uncharacterized protein YycO
MFTAGDIVLANKKSLIVWFMRIFQSDPVDWGHVLIYLGNNMFIENSFPFIRIIDIDYFKKRYEHYKWFSYKNMTTEKSNELTELFESKLCKPYSYTRIILQMFDHLFNTNFFTGFLKNDDKQICSSFVAWGYNKIFGVDFNNVNWYSCDPDDIDDHCSNNSDWVLSGEVNG